MNRVFQMPTQHQPVLTTARLVLRAFTKEDAKRVMEVMNDWEVAKMMAPVPYPYPLEQAENWIASHNGTAHTGTDITFAIWHKNELIGSINVENRGDNKVGIGYWLAQTHWGNGFASEAVAEILRYAFEDLEQTSLTTDIFDDNNASARVLEKAGFHLYAHISGWSEPRGKTCAKREYHLTRERWQAQNKPL